MVENLTSSTCLHHDVSNGSSYDLTIHGLVILTIVYCIYRSFGYGMFVRKHRSLFDHMRLVTH